MKKVGPHCIEVGLNKVRPPVSFRLLVLGSGVESGLDLVLLMLEHGGGLVAEQAELVLIGLLPGGVALGTTEDILVLHLWEVDAIVPVRVSSMLNGVISVIDPGTVRTQVLGLTGSPVLDLEIADRLALVVVTDDHSALVSLVVNSLCAKNPLALLTKAFQNMVGAHLHNADLLVSASSLALLRRTSLVLADLTVAAARNSLRLQSHELGVLHVRVDHRTVLVTESLAFTVRVPVVVILVVSVVFVERVVQVTINPGKLRDVTEVERQLRQLTVGLVIVVLAQRIHLLVEVVVHEPVAEVPMRLQLVCEVLSIR